MRTLLKNIYICSIVPLLSISASFFFWFYKRTWMASDVDIEFFAAFTVIGFFLLALATIALTIIFIVKNRTDWKKTIIPIAIVGVTFPLIDLYGTLYSTLSDKAFVRIINDTDRKIERIWSDNFEMINYEDAKTDLIVSFYPVYTYDWTIESSTSFNYYINTIYIDLKQKNNITETYYLPELSKGDCKTIKLTEIINGKSTMHP